MPVVTCLPSSPVNTPDMILTESGSWRWVGEPRLARPALVEKDLNVGRLERNMRRTAVDHAADRDPVAFAKAGEAEQMTEGVERHGGFVPRRVCGGQIKRRKVPNGALKNRISGVARQLLALEHIDHAPARYR